MNFIYTRILSSQKGKEKWFQLYLITADKSNLCHEKQWVARACLVSLTCRGSRNCKSATLLDSIESEAK